MQPVLEQPYPIWDLINDLLIELDTSLQITYTNPKTCQLFQLDNQALLHKHWVNDCVPSEQRQYIHGIVNNFLGTTQPTVTFNHDILTLSGERKTISWTARRSSSPSGHPVKLILIGEDISDLLQQGQANRQSELKYLTIFNHSPIGIEVFDRHGKLIDANKTCLEIFGINSVNDIRGFELFEDPNINIDIIEAIKHGRTISFESEFDFDKITSTNLYPTSKKGIIYLNVQITPIGNSSHPTLYLVQVQDISHRRLAEQASELSQERYMSIFNNGDDAIFVHHMDGSIADVNQIACERLGYTESEFHMLPHQALYPPSKAAEIPKYIQVLLTKGSVIFETEHLTKQGISLPVEISSRIIQYSGKKYILSISRDIKERVRYKQDLLAEHQRTQQYLRVAGVMILVINADQTVGLINQKGCEILGRDKDDIIGKDWFGHFTPPNRQKDLRHIFNRMFSGYAAQYEYWESEVLTRSGEQRIIGWHNTLLKDDRGQPYATLSSGEDITEKKQAQNSIQRTATIRAILHQFMSLALEDLPFSEMTDKIINLLIALPWLDLAPKGSLYLLDETTKVYKQIASSGFSDEEKLAFSRFVENQGVCGHAATNHKINFEQYLSPTGEKHINFCVPLVASGKRTIGAIHLFLNPGKTFDYSNESLLETIAQVIVSLIQQKQAEDQLKLAYKRTHEVMAAISSILIVINENNVVTQWNSVAEQSFGISKKDAIGQYFPDLAIPWEQRHMLKKLPFVVYNNNAMSVKNVHYKRPDNSGGFLNITVSPVRGDSKETAEYLLIATDITDIKVLEAQLMQSQKLEAIGQLAAGIAHEINTPTQYVGDNVRFLQESYDNLAILIELYGNLLNTVKNKKDVSGLVREIDDCIQEIDLEYLGEEIPNAIEQSIDGISRIVTIVKAMKGFAHPDQSQKKLPVNLNQAIENTVTVARNEWKYVAYMNLQLDPELPVVKCLAGEINQVVLNLIVNASHAIADANKNNDSERGTITISTSRSDETVVIQIQDTGGGIPQAIQEKIFDPFFTTKEVGRGTGQGLAISRSVIIDKHEGRLYFKTQEGIGTTFFIELPLK